MAQWCAQGGGGTFASHLGEMRIFVSHLGEMSHLPAPYTSNQTPFGGIEKHAPSPTVNVLHTSQ